MQQYLASNYWYSVSMLCVVYIVLQAFAIPGPAIIAVLMAALFGGWVGGAMSLACSLIGSSICYYIFKKIGKPILTRFCKTRLAQFKRQIVANKEGLFFYFLFLRVTPILPNWFINIASGNIGIRYRIFLFGSLLGLLPNAIILATAGVELSKFGETGMIGFDGKRAAGLVGIGCLALLPIFVKRFMNKKFKNSKSK